MGKHVYLRSVINFCNDFTIGNLCDFNLIGGEDDFFWRPSVSYLIHWQEIRGKTQKYNTLLKLPWSRSILPFPILSVRELSPKTIGGPFDMSREENISLVETICLEALESMMKLGELEGSLRRQQPRHVLSPCLLN